MASRVIIVPVPTDMELVFDGKCWTIAPSPPRWFLEMTDAGNDVIIEQPAAFRLTEVVAPEAA